MRFPVIDIIKCSKFVLLFWEILNIFFANNWQNSWLIVKKLTFTATYFWNVRLSSVNTAIAFINAIFTNIPKLLWMHKTKNLKKEKKKKGENIF